MSLDKCSILPNLHLSLSQTKQNMTTNKATIASSVTQPIQVECCMCGDCGLSYELFQCKLCQFRSQHRYCSHLYPKAQTYEVCNWCLSLDSKEKSQNSSNSSSSHKNNSDDSTKNIKCKKKSSENHQESIKSQRSLQLQVISPIKKQRSPERQSPLSRRRIITTARLEEKLIRRTKSDDITNNGITKVFRNKVRRYKLLDEVSS